MRFDTKINRGGCCSKNHHIDVNDGENNEIYQIIHKRMNLIKEPFIRPEGINHSLTKSIKHVNIGEYDENSKETYEIPKEKALDIYVEMYSLLNKRSEYNSDEEEDEEEDEDDDEHLYKLRRNTLDKKSSIINNTNKTTNNTTQNTNTNNTNIKSNNITKNYVTNSKFNSRQNSSDSS